MKKIALTLLMGLIGMTVLAQNEATPTETKVKKRKTIVRPAKCPPIYVTTSTGINNNTGIIGFSFDVPVSKNVSIDAGPGTGTWGYRIYAGAKYYLRPCHRGFAFGAGLTYCSGVRDDKHDLTTVYGNTETIEYNKNPQTSFFFAAYKYWSIGKKYNRIFVELGWSTPLSHNDKITQLTGDPISSKTRDGLNSSYEGGPVLGFGLSFGMH